MLYLEDSNKIENAHDQITYMKSIISFSGKISLKFEELLDI